MIINHLGTGLSVIIVGSALYHEPLSERGESNVLKASDAVSRWIWGIFPSPAGGERGGVLTPHLNVGPVKTPETAAVMKPCVNKVGSNGVDS